MAVNRLFLCSCAIPFLVLSSFACNIPVFRFALEFWETDPYEAIIFYSDSLDSNLSAFIRRFDARRRDSLSANVVIFPVDTADSKEEWVEAIYRKAAIPQLPWMILRYPKSARIGLHVWEGPADISAIRRLIDSPLRKEITERLSAGENGVFLLVESGDETQDKRAGSLIDKELKALQKKLKLPETIEDPHFEVDTSLGPPIRVAFSSLRCSRDNPAEDLLVSMLLKSSPGVAEAKEPVLFILYGRGRVLPPLAGNAISAETLGRMCSFLIGECACTAKAENPGIDILFRADWEEIRSRQRPVTTSDQPLPPLHGLTSFFQSLDEPGGKSGDGAFPRIVWILAIAAILVVAGGTVVLLLKKRR